VRNKLADLIRSDSLSAGRKVKFSVILSNAEEFLVANTTSRIRLEPREVSQFSIVGPAVLSG
jgi:hypothetical protein